MKVKNKKEKKVRFIDMFNAIKDTEEYKRRIVFWKVILGFNKNNLEFIHYPTTVKEMYDKLIKK